jgi:hypothetical protein
MEERDGMPSRPVELLEAWYDLARIDPARRPDPSPFVRAFPDCIRPAAPMSEIAAWEERYGFALPGGVKCWLALSDGLFADGPLIHPLASIGPMIPFARVPGLVVQPESWFELGNPNVETVCIDLAYRCPDGDCPVFTSGDDDTGSPPRLIACGFDDWLLGVIASGGREYWFEPDFADLGDPWAEHVLHVPAPTLADRLRPFADRVLPLVRAGLDDRAIAARFGLSPFDVEAIARHVQHSSRTAGPAHRPS